MIEVTITMQAIVPETASDAYRAVMTRENTPLPIVFADISIPEREQGDLLNSRNSNLR
jgi:hypothetical protein